MLEGVELPTRDLFARSGDVLGTVVLTAPDAIRRLDLATGALRWTVTPPHAASCIANAALAIPRRLIAVQQYGTAFGAGD